jgi:hypothetical protein
MVKLRVAIVIVLLAVPLFAGCSGDEGQSPMDQGRFGSGLVAGPENIGPSDIVFCIDVSDTVTVDELSSMVSALGTSLSNPQLIPQDGSMLIGAYVYGDTVVPIITPGTAVDATALSDVIIPALEGLLDDRIVTGAGADLSGAMGMARTDLGAASNLDRHVLLMGSGVADDAAAVEAECTELNNIGVMVSAIGAGSDDFTLFKECAGNTGGFFGSGTESLNDICAEAFAYMLQVDIDLEPEMAELKRNEEHTLTGNVFRGGDAEKYPEVGSDVSIMIVEGPNAGETASAVTDTLGMFVWTYTGDGGPGTDFVVAETAHPGTGNALVDTVMVEWLNEPPTCDAGGPYDVTFASDSAYVMLDASGSSDLDGDSLTFHWAVDCEDGASFDDPESMTPNLMLMGDCLCVDSLAVTLTVSDGYDETTCESVIHLNDMRPPVVELREAPVILWPPNHKYHTITPEMFVESIEDACGRPISIDAAVEILIVHSDEPEDGTGDGKTMNDIIVECPHTAKLRAERMGGMTGRVYTIKYTVTGANGASVVIDGTVVVPHDRSGRDVVPNPFGGYSVTPDCGGGNGE